MSLTAVQHRYLAEMMQKVSRSFALVAPAVETPLDDYLAAAYLICRVADNIEDAQQSYSWQQARFAEFMGLLKEPETAELLLTDWEEQDWLGLTADEQAMMARSEGLALWEILAGMPGEMRISINHWVSQMVFGMERSNNPAGSDFFVIRHGVRLPVGVSDYDMYCFYVAGTVGRLISDMAISFYTINGSAAQSMRIGSEIFGRALQKTNIVKDFTSDLRRQICYLPDAWLSEVNYRPLTLSGAPAAWKRKVITNVLAELINSVEFLITIPLNALGLRKACLMMMLPAFQTILLAAQNMSRLFTEQNVVKISRITMLECVLKANNLAGNDNAIREYAREFAVQMEQQLEQAMVEQF
ncbi:MAG: squalene/phytoene synthase family protein [Candidatus Promineifilaceae bacterium]|jgi:farnesyl-diphosphate farnesyltransferase